MKKLSLLILIIGVAALLTGLWLFYSSNGNRVAYVKSEEIFSKFEMTKELQARYDQTLNARKNLLDSMELELRLMLRELRENNTKDPMKMNAFKEREAEYQERKQRFEEDSQSLTTDYNQQVWTRINQYTKEFGEKNRYQYVLGANGDGSLMYAEESLDVTAALLEYMNTQYRGGTK